MENGNGSSNPLIRAGLIINGIGLLGVIGYLITVSESVGERARQIDVNSARLTRIEEVGSPGLRGRLEEIDRRLKAIEDRLYK